MHNRAQKTSAGLRPWSGSKTNCSIVGDLFRKVATAARLKKRDFKRVDGKAESGCRSDGDHTVPGNWEAALREEACPQDYYPTVPVHPRCVLLQNQLS